MPTVQRANANRDGKIEQLFARRELEVLDRYLTETQAAGLLLGLGLLDRLGRSVDGQYRTLR